MERLAGKTALVTGGGRGIGRGIVLEFARAGADVAINYRRDREAAEATVAEVTALGRRAVALQADVANYDAVQAMVASAVAELGKLDIVVANAGTTGRRAISRHGPRARRRAHRSGRSEARVPTW